MPTLDFYVVENCGTNLFSFSVGTEGVFLFIAPLQFAILWPWVKL
ncbi:hypothetical protein [Variovorax sp. HJSM1_2]